MLAFLGSDGLKNKFDRLSHIDTSLQPIGNVLWGSSSETDHMVDYVELSIEYFT